MTPKSSGMNTMVLPNVHGSQLTIVLPSMKPSAPVTAGSGETARLVRRNQYVARPATESLRTLMSVSARPAGNTNTSAVSGNSSAVCGLEKNGTPVYAYGFQNG